MGREKWEKKSSRLRRGREGKRSSLGWEMGRGKMGG